MSSEMRVDDDGAVWPKSEEQFVGYIRGLLAREKPIPYAGGEYQPEDGYNYTAQAMALAAIAALNYVSVEFGCTGFQASCAELEFLRISRGLKGPFAVIDGSKMLYPQYDILSDVKKYLVEWQPWANKEAASRLAENAASDTHPTVYAHWQALAALEEAQS